MDASAPQGGILARLRAIVAALLALVATRLELLSVDLQEGLWHAAGVLLLTMAALALGCLALAMLGFTIVIAFWADHRLRAAALVMLGYALLALAAGLAARRRLRARPRFLAASLAELEADRAALGDGPP
jgi:uncharacterized membrane protein YqjE